ncbi:MAG: methyltransferase domain-containing protein [Chloroflexi bacterium]|nr:methyltransferase domain-containing protein [Chloroflexota bacterium]
MVHSPPPPTGPEPVPEPTPQELFTWIFHTNYWGSEESVSGHGSELSETVDVRQAVARVLDRYRVRSVVDAGCGDLNWQRHVPGLLDRTRYLGLDVVTELITRNRQRHGNQRVRFAHADITRDPIPPADLVICRDCMVHLTNAQILRALQHVVASGSAHLLATTYSAEPVNQDRFHDGHWRPVNLSAPPFSLPPPIELYNTDYRDDGRNHPGNGLGLWPVECIPALEMPVSTLAYR